MPGGVVFLLRIAAREASGGVGGSPKYVLRKAARFFLERLLFSRESEICGMLDVDPHSHAVELSRAALLQKHSSGPRTRSDHWMLACLRIQAWDDLKTRQRRAIYDQSLIEIDFRRSSLGANGGDTRYGTLSVRSRGGNHSESR